MWKAGLALMATLAGTPALALFTTGDALVIGNARYDETLTGFGAAEVQDVARALRLRGQQVEALANGGSFAMTQAFEAFVATIEADETPLVVVLSGQFEQGALKPVGDQTGAGLSLTAVLEVLGQSPRRAFLMLGMADGGPEGGLDPDTLAIPDGVTVIHGPADKLAQFAAQEMAQPGTGLKRSAGWYDLAIAGYMADGLVVLDHTETRPPTKAEQAAAQDRARRAEDAIWQHAQATGTPATYLASFPQGRYADAAQKPPAIADAGPADPSTGDPVLDRPARLSIQRDLARLGYNTRGIDGIFGPATRAAITAWQGRIGAPETGVLNTDQIARLAKMAAQTSQTVVAGLPVAPRAAEPGVVAVLSPQEVATLRVASGEAGLRMYLARYPQGAYAQRARVLLSNIQRGSGP